MREAILYCITAKLEALVIGKATVRILCATGKHLRRFIRDGIDRRDFILVPKLLPKRSRKKQFLVAGSTVIKKEHFQARKRRER